MSKATFFNCNLCFFCCSYDNDGTSKDEIKERFSQTMEFVENYLRDVVCQSFPFADKEKNKLTFEVTRSNSHSRVTVVTFLTNFNKPNLPCLGGESGQELDLFWLLQLQ